MISTLRNNNPNRRPSSSFYCYVEAQKLPLPKLITMQKQTEALTQRQARRAALNLICPGSANQKTFFFFFSQVFFNYSGCNLIIWDFLVPILILLLKPLIKIL
ncbi:unnamed protein product, partial [Heterosigma akashiwo]